MHTLNPLKFQASKSSLAHLSPFESLQSLILFFTITLFSSSSKKASPKSANKFLVLPGIVDAISLTRSSAFSLTSESHLIASPKQVQSLPAPPNHLQPDDRRTQCLDGCLTIQHDGDRPSLATISSVQIFSIVQLSMG